METKHQQYQEQPGYPVRLYLSAAPATEKQLTKKCNDSFLADNTEEYTELRNVCIRLVQIHHQDRTKTSTRIPLYRNVLLHFDTVQKPYRSKTLEHHNQCGHNDKNSDEF